MRTRKEGEKREREREREKGRKEERKTYVDFSQDGKAHAVIQLAKLLNVVVGARVLAAKLVAREAEDFKVVGVGPGLDVLVQLLEAGELGGEAALGGGVDDEDDFAGELGEVVGLVGFWMG